MRELLTVVAWLAGLWCLAGATAVLYLHVNFIWRGEVEAVGASAVAWKWTAFRLGPIAWAVIILLAFGNDVDRARRAAERKMEIEEEEDRSW